MIQMFETKDMPIVVSLASRKSVKKSSAGLILPYRVKWLD